MADIADLNARRWDAIDDPAKHDPAEALRAAGRALAEAKDMPEHIIVLFGRTPADGASATRFFQAGSYAHHAQLGLIEEGKLMIRETG